MSTVKLDLDQPGLWTEEDFLSLGETKTRIELIDGGLWVSPSSNNSHNEILGILHHTLRNAAPRGSLRTILVPNLRLAPKRILIPDIAVGLFVRSEPINPASQALLVVEITSPGNAVVDRTLKSKLYAEAKIDWYLLVEPDFDDYDSLSLHLFRRVGDEYIVHAEAKHGQTLISDEPFPIEISTADLLDF